jgi:hypothetical protein
MRSASKQARNNDRALIRDAIAASDVARRRDALQALLEAIRQDRSLRHEALAIFRSVVARDRDPWSVVIAARGVAATADAAETRRTWLDLLGRADVDAVVGAIRYLGDASPYVQTLLALLEQRREPQIQSAIIRTLGFLRVNAAVPAIVARLAVPVVQADCVVALAEIGDPSVIRNLEDLLDNETPAWNEEGRGTRPLRDLAQDAISSLRARATAAGAVRQVPTQATAAPPARVYTFAVWLPIIALILTVPWFMTIVFEMITRGARTGKSANPRTVAFVTAVPALVGLAAGFIVVVRGLARSRGQRIVLAVGCIGCALIVWGFVQTLIP